MPFRNQSPLLAAKAPGAWVPMQQLPQPRTDFWALLESAGLWLALLLAGLVLMLAMLLALQRAEAQRFRDARLMLVLQEMREAVESELALGLDLVDIGQTQNLLENALLKDPSLLSADVMDQQSLLLFSTDRGLVGESVPTPVAIAARQQAEKTSHLRGQEFSRQSYWLVPGEDDRVLGLLIRNPFAQTLGSISVTSLPVETTRPTWIGWAALGLAAVTAVLAGLAARWASRIDHRASGESVPLQQAASVLAATSKRQEAALAQLIADQEQAF